MAADQQQVLSDHVDEVVSALEVMSLAGDTDAEGLPYKVLRDRVRELVAGRGPQLAYDELVDVLDSLDPMVEATEEEGEPEAAAYRAAHEAVADLLYGMQAAHLRPHLDPINEALDVQIGGAETEEEADRVVHVKELVNQDHQLHEDELDSLADQLEGGADAYQGSARQRVFEKALKAVRGARDVARSGKRRAAPGVAQALDTINAHRRRLGMTPLDPAAAGWSEEDVLLEAERVDRLPNLGSLMPPNPKPKRKPRAPAVGSGPWKALYGARVSEHRYAAGERKQPHLSYPNRIVASLVRGGWAEAGKKYGGVTILKLTPEGRALVDGRAESGRVRDPRSLLRSARSRPKPPSAPR